MDNLYTLDNGKSYIIIKHAFLEGKEYAYISNIHDDSDTMFVEIVDQNNTIAFDKLRDKKLNDKLIKVMFEN